MKAEEFQLKPWRKPMKCEHCYRKPAIKLWHGLELCKPCWIYLRYLNRLNRWARAGGTPARRRT